MAHTFKATAAHWGSYAWSCTGNNAERRRVRAVFTKTIKAWRKHDSLARYEDRLVNAQGARMRKRIYNGTVTEGTKLAARLQYIHEQHCMRDSD